MLTFAEFLNEDKVNYNPHTQAWQVRGDSDNHPFKHEQKQVMLKNAAPYIDHDAHESGKMLHAFIKGYHTKDRPTSSTHTQRHIKFEKSDVHPGFVHVDDNSPVRKADYIEFNNKHAIAHYKK